MISNPHKVLLAGKPAGRPASLKVRSDLRAGANGACELGLQYWKKEYNTWKKIAQNMGCA